MFEARVFEQIRGYWIADQNHPQRGTQRRPIPALRDLVMLIETAFVASLKREEERFPKFSVVLLAEKEKDREQESSGLKQEIVVLDRRLPFSPESLAKLSPACDPQTGAWIVSPPEDDSKNYEIWGLMFFGPTTNGFTQVSVGHEFTTFRPDVLTVTAVSPGSLVVSRRDRQIGRFVLGNFSPATPMPFVSRAMGEFMISSIKDSQGYQKYGNLYWHIYRDALEYLLLEAGARGHGGTIIVIPENKVAECRTAFQAKYPLQGALRIEKLIEQILSLPKSYEMATTCLSYNRAIANRLNFLAQLACVDGALLLSDHLEPLGFGATIAAQEWTGNIVVGPDSFGGGGQEFDLSRLGTRHNSAANFIGAFPYCYGFVLSQDGPIRGFIRKDENTLYCWPDCTVSMFVQ